MTGVVPVIPRVKFTNAAGVPIALGWVTVYEAGTTTLTDSWQDKAQATLNTNPIHLDANGECLLWVDSSKTYKLLLQDAALATVSGWPVDNIPGAADISAAATAAAAAAQPYVDDAEAAKDDAEAAQAAAEVAQAAAEAARDATLAAGSIYASTAAGIAGTSSGEYFYVVSAESTESLELWKNNAGVAQDTGKRLIDSSFFTTLDTTTRPSAYLVMDGDNRVAFQVTADGTTVMADAEAEAFAVETLTAGAATIDEFTAGGGTFVDEFITNFQWAVEDADGNVAVGIDEDGNFHAKALYVNGVQVAGSSISRNGGVFPYQINYINNMGQSLAEGSNGDLTTSQEYDNVGFAARSSTGASIVTLTVANTQQASRGESPMYGALGHAKELILEENGIAYADNDYQLLACNNGYSGYTLTQLDKGTSEYTLVMNQITSGVNAAAALGKSFCFAATIWTQGESDGATATYEADLIQLASDLNTDGKALTGQQQDAAFITYQTNSLNVAGLTNVALGQLAAANKSRLIYMACPTYFLPFYDTQHVTATGSKWLGGYYGLAYKRVVIDKQEWQPLQPIGHAVLGAVIDLYFNKTGLTFDTTGVPAQTNQGFTVADSGGSALTISSVAVIAPNRVRLTMSATVAAGAVVKYGMIAAAGMTNFTGGAGNLRDNQGDSIVYSSISKPMHNWCVIFSYSV